MIDLDRTIKNITNGRSLIVVPVVFALVVMVIGGIGLTNAQNVAIVQTTHLSVGNDTQVTNLTSMDYWVLHWYYPMMVVGFLIAAIAGYTRHWLIFILGIGIELFCYLYMMSGGVMIGWLTGTGV